MATGVSVDLGFGATKICPVVDGHCLYNEGRVMVINGEEMGNILMQEAVENSEKETKKYINTRQSEFSRIQLG